MLVSIRLVFTPLVDARYKKQLDADEDATGALALSSHLVARRRCLLLHLKAGKLEKLDASNLVPEPSGIALHCQQVHWT
jgi:hypothetical protein